MRINAVKVASVLVTGMISKRWKYLLCDTLFGLQLRVKINYEYGYVNRIW
jgi:hypothetical protein